MAQMTSNQLMKHISKTYFKLRVGLGVLAILFPSLLIIVGLIKGIEIQDSISAYYHVDNMTRNILVGLLSAVGIFLYLYCGFTGKENIALNFAGFFAICVALIPMGWPKGAKADLFNAHGFSAIALFLCMAYVCIFCASATLKLLNNANKAKKFKLIYLIIGVLMILTPLIAWSLAVLFNYSFIIVIEIICIVVFAVYWLLKSLELYISNADEKVFMKKFDL